MVEGSPLLAVNRRNARKKASTFKRVVYSKCIPRVEAQVNKQIYALQVVSRGSSLRMKNGPVKSILVWEVGYTSRAVGNTFDLFA